MWYLLQLIDIIGSIWLHLGRICWPAEFVNSPRMILGTATVSSVGVAREIRHLGVGSPKIPTQSKEASKLIPAGSYRLGQGKRPVKS